MLILIWLVVAACAPPQPAQTSQTGDVNVGVVIETGGAVGPFTLQITLTDDKTAPIKDASVQVQGTMNHAGMVPVDSGPIRDDADGRSDGVYPIPFEFTMRGDWILTLTITLPDGTTVHKDVQVSVHGTGVEVRE
jgi:hypothetical protein